MDKKLNHLNTIKIELHDKYLKLDAITIKNLELVKNINGEKENRNKKILGNILHDHFHWQIQAE